MAETPEAPKDQEGNLTIADLQTISNIIDIAMTRGAFRANEAKTVGESYEKINAFLQTVQQTAADQQAQQQAQQAQQQAAAQPQHAEAQQQAQQQISMAQQQLMQLIK